MQPRENYRREINRILLLRLHGYPQSSSSSSCRRRPRARENDPDENRTDQQLLNRDGVKEGLGNGNGDDQGTGVKELEMNSICAVERGGP